MTARTIHADDDDCDESEWWARPPEEGRQANRPIMLLSLITLARSPRSLVPIFEARTERRKRRQRRKDLRFRLRRTTRASEGATYGFRRNFYLGRHFRGRANLPSPQLKMCDPPTANNSGHLCATGCNSLLQLIILIFFFLFPPSSSS